MFCVTDLAGLNPALGVGWLLRSSRLLISVSQTIGVMLLPGDAMICRMIGT
jgi:hypothetical protein